MYVVCMYVYIYTHISMYHSFNKFFSETVKSDMKHYLSVSLSLKAFSLLAKNWNDKSDMHHFVSIWLLPRVNHLLCRDTLYWGGSAVVSLRSTLLRKGWKSLGFFFISGELFTQINFRVKGTLILFKTSILGVGGIKTQFSLNEKHFAT